jgi:pimeloyl-ACP methyl ester carboxylesterase
MPVANINGVDLNYEVNGQGQAVVFLHGMTGSTRDWANQIAVLSPEYRVIALDMRGTANRQHQKPWQGTQYQSLLRMFLGY